MRLGWMVALLPGCVVIEHDDLLEDRVFDGPIEGVVADVGAGGLTVEVGGGTEAVLTREVRWTGEAPEADAWMDGDVLRIDVNCRTLQRVCVVDHHLILPDAAALDARLGSGALVASGLTGRVAVDVGSGTVSLADVAGDIQIDAGSGDIEVIGVTGDLAIDAGSGSVVVEDADVVTAAVDGGSGSVTLEFVRGPNDVWVHTGSGEVRIDVPAGTYRVDADTGSGTLTLDGITVDQRADRTIDAQTGSGDLRIRGL